MIEKIINFEYRPENADLDEKTISGLEILEMCKGNVKYCLSVIDRLTWQYPQTLIQEDIAEGEILLIEDQILMTNGKEIF